MKRPTVLLIDDEASVRLPLRLSLEHGGYQVVEADNGMEGLAALGGRGEDIALVIVDYQMPQMSGADVIGAVRRLPHRLPIILMSGLSAVETDAGRCQPEAFLRKPFELVDLARAVRRLIGPGAPSASPPHG